jgi:hypothetical protein
MRFFSFYPNSDNSLALVQADAEYFEMHRFVGSAMAAQWQRNGSVMAATTTSRPRTL